MNKIARLLGIGHVRRGHQQQGREGASPPTTDRELPPRRALETRTRTSREGRVPGSGREQQTITERPDDPSLVSVKQLQARVGVSNPAVINKVIARLRIRPAGMGAWSRTTYNHGGSGYRYAEVPRYEASIEATLRHELESRARGEGNGWFSYEATRFRWAK